MTSLAVRALRISLAFVAGVALASIASAQADGHVGVWKLNPAKTTGNGGPPPRSATLTYEADGKGLTYLVQGIDAAGKPINPGKTKVAVNFDGKDHAVASPDYETSAWRRLDANSYSFTRKKAGKVVASGMNVVSKDGRSMAIKTTAINPKGGTTTVVDIYEKQR
jgi:hypothetical protein